MRPHPQRTTRSGPTDSKALRILSGRSTQFYIAAVVIDRFNPAARIVLVIAQDEARKNRSSLMDTDHLLVALTVSLGSDSSRALALLGVSEAQVRKQVDNKRGRRRTSPPHIPFSPELKQVIRAGETWANDHGEPHIGSEHLLLGLVQHPLSAGGRILTDLGVSLSSAQDALAKAAESGQPAAELRDVARVPTGPYAVPRAASKWRRRAAAAETSVRSVMRVDSPPELAWSLLSSPHVWALNPRGCVMFDAPGPDQPLWLLAGHLPGNPGVGEQCRVFEPSTTPTRMELELLPGARDPLRFTLSVVPRSGGSSDISVTRTRPLPRDRGRGNGAEAAMKLMTRELDEWLSVIRDVLEGRNPSPAGEIPPQLLRAWTAERRIEQQVTKSAAVLIDAEPDAVWDVLHSTWSPAVEGWPPVVCAGNVPGAPLGAVGEMQYVVFRRRDGSLVGSVDVVIGYEERRTLVFQDISSWGGRNRYQLSAEPGKSRLEVTCEWPGAKLAVNTGANAARLLESPGKFLDGYKTYIESRTRGTAGPA